MHGFVQPPPSLNADGPERGPWPHERRVMLQLPLVRDARRPERRRRHYPARPRDNRVTRTRMTRG